MPTNITTPLALGTSEAATKAAIQAVKLAYLNDGSTPTSYGDARASLNTINTAFGFAAINNGDTTDVYMPKVNKLIDLEQTLDVTRFAIDNADATAKPYAARADFRLGRHLLTGVAAGSIAAASVASLINPAISTFADMFTFTRASTATYIDSAGVMQTAAINAPRIDYTNGVPQLLVEGASTNLFPNSGNTGAVVGVIGSGGAIPSTHQMGSATGVTRQVVAVGTMNGIPYYDLRLYGTNTSGTTQYPDIQFSNNATNPSAVSGETWTFSGFVQLLAGAWPSVTPEQGRVSVKEYSAAPSYLSSSSTPSQIDGTFSRKSHTRTLTNASTAKVTGYIAMAIANGETVDFTVRIGGVQLEKLPFATSYIPTTSSAVTRAGDSVLFGSKLLALLNRQGTTVVLKGRARGLQPSGTLIGVSNGQIMRQGFGVPSQVGIGIQGSPAIAGLFFDSILPGPFGAGLAYASASRAASANGQAAVTDTNTMALGYTSVFLGSASGGDAGYFWADEIMIFPFRATNASLRAEAVAYA